MYLLILLNIALKKEYLGKFFTLDLKVGHCGVCQKKETVRSYLATNQTFETSLKNSLSI